MTVGLDLMWKNDVNGLHRHGGETRPLLCVFQGRYRFSGAM